MVAIIVWQNWLNILLGLALAGLGIWYIRKGEVYRRWGGVYTREENPVAFWMSVSLTIGIAIFFIIKSIRHWQ